MGRGGNAKARYPPCPQGLEIRANSRPVFHSSTAARTVSESHRLDRKTLPPVTPECYPCPDLKALPMS
jgi:hypothetical protein